MTKSVCTLQEDAPKQTSLSAFWAISKKRKSAVGRAASEKSTSINPSKKPKVSQLYLDFGQSDFGKHLKCHVCGMMFVHGVDEDLKTHARICNEYQYGVRFSPQSHQWKMKRVAEGAFIVEINPNTSRSHRMKLERIQEVVERDLDFVATKTDAPQRPSQKAFVYVAQKRVVGLVVAERITQAFEARRDVANQPTVPAQLGIFQLWVHAKFRRKGIASQLVDQARECMVYGWKVPVNKLAFSAPTQAGLAFATGFFAKHKCRHVLVYDCSAMTEELPNAQC